MVEAQPIRKTVKKRGFSGNTFAIQTPTGSKPVAITKPTFVGFHPHQPTFVGFVCIAAPLRVSVFGEGIVRETQFLI
ncbi:hypothetical protein [Argonema galeatum]|uniref:hypothetical protein n=1 Tax=Argonema galeatum TaxID=2942762 RepID=UPI002013AABB|nr:hypothetical protein [Argonema galeatum]MCL1466077.1 hypothetical protein [Argonema galeatum A003/A1]